MLSPMKTHDYPDPVSGTSFDLSGSRQTAISRRAALKSTIAAIGFSALAFEPGRAAEAGQSDARRGSPKRYDMKKSINLWAFPYPARMSLRECLQLARNAGFDGIELNYDLDNDLSPKVRPRRNTAPFAKWQTRSASQSAAFARSFSGPIR